MSLKEVSDATFQKEIASQSGLVLVDFWAPWCGPCQAIAPVLEQIAAEEGTTVSIFKVNIEDNPETPTSFGVRSIPTLILFKEGAPVATQVGGLPKEDLIRWINKNAG
jgi:thioredoxin 1